MKRVLFVVFAALLALPSSMAGAAAPAAMEPAQLFVGGGTFVSNGVFFPGTAVYDGNNLQGLPLAVERGQNVMLTNLDHGDIANGHVMQSLKRRKKNGRPLFQSKRIAFPGAQSLVITSHLKPGIYEFYCPVHTGMWGLLEIGA
jgi:hypothetical protein